jgi:MFS family permease
MVDDGSVARAGTFEALKNPGFRRYFAGQGVSLIGTWLQAAAVRWIVYEQTRSEFLLGVVEMASLMPGLLVGLVAGLLADRVPPRRMILLTLSWQTLQATVLAVLVGLGIVEFWQLALILALGRVGVTFELTSRQVLLYDLVGVEGLTNAIALNSGLFNATRVIGPALAGICLAALGPTSCFVLNALSYLAAIAAVATISLPARRPRRGTSRGTSELLGGLDYLRRNRRVRVHFELMAAFGVVGMGYEAMIPAFASDLVGTGVRGYSLILASAGLGATAGALAVARLSGTPRKDRLIVAGAAVFGVFLGIAGLFPVWSGPSWPDWLRLGTAAASVLGVGFGAALFYSSVQTSIQLMVPDHLRGRIMGVWMILYSASVPLGALWTGRAAAEWGVSNVIFPSAVGCLAMALGVAASGALRLGGAPAPADPLLGQPSLTVPQQPARAGGQRPRAARRPPQ